MDIPTLKTLQVTSKDVHDNRLHISDSHHEFQENPNIPLFRRPKKASPNPQMIQEFRNIIYWLGGRFGYVPFGICWASLNDSGPFLSDVHWEISRQSATPSQPLNYAMDSCNELSNISSSTSCSQGKNPFNCGCLQGFFPKESIYGRFTCIDPIKIK